MVRLVCTFFFIVNISFSILVADVKYYSSGNLKFAYVLIPSEGGYIEVVNQTNPYIEIKSNKGYGFKEFGEFPESIVPRNSQITNRFWIDSDINSNSYDPLTIYFHKDIIYVDDNAGIGGDGNSWATAFSSLQDALVKALPGDEIWVAEGSYTPDQGKERLAGDRTASFELNTGVNLYGGFLGNEMNRMPEGNASQTILSGSINDDFSLHSIHVVTINPNSVGKIILDGFTITQGNANGDGTLSKGGGVYGMSTKQCYLYFNNCFFKDNKSVDSGAAVYINEHSYGSRATTFNNCTFIGNHAGNDGGAVFASGKVNFKRCIFQKNYAENSGGAVYSWGSRFENCKFIENMCDGLGGGAVRGGNFYSRVLF